MVRPILKYAAGAKKRGRKRWLMAITQCGGHRSWGAVGDNETGAVEKGKGFVDLPSVKKQVYWGKKA